MNLIQKSLSALLIGLLCVGQAVAYPSAQVSRASQEQEELQEQTVVQKIGNILKHPATWITIGIIVLCVVVIRSEAGRPRPAPRVVYGQEGVRVGVEIHAAPEPVYDPWPIDYYRPRRPVYVPAPVMVIQQPEPRVVFTPAPVYHPPYTPFTPPSAPFMAPLIPSPVQERRHVHMVGKKVENNYGQYDA